MADNFFKNCQLKRFLPEFFREETFEAIAECRIARPESPQAYQATPRIHMLNKYQFYSGKNHDIILQ
ncbi:MAG: hypothetical protein JXR70_00900 [Spirochaetales bacterium]|nr:hypothetical protein [Spirochaetales bacterium]